MLSENLFMHKKFIFTFFAACHQGDTYKVFAARGKNCPPKVDSGLLFHFKLLLIFVCL